MVMVVALAKHILLQANKQQWGKYQSGGGSNRTVTVSFPISFGTVYGVTLGNIRYNSNPDIPTQITSLSNSSFNVFFDDWMAGAYWFALGV